MARRKAAASSRLNFEIAGIAAIGIAALLGIALAVAPPHAGIAGDAVARALHWAFGSAAPLFPVLIAIFGAILFLEIDLPRILARNGLAATLCFLLIDVAFATRGGFVGGNIWNALRALVGLAGARTIVTLLAIVLVIWIGNFSVKALIGRLIALFARMRMPKLKLQLPAGHDNLRKAFALPASEALVPVAPKAPVAIDRVEDDEEEETGEDEEFEDDELDEEDESELADEEDQEEEDEPEEDDEPEDSFQEAIARAAVATILEEERQESAPAAVYEPPSVAGTKRAYRLPDLALFDPPQTQAVDESSRSAVLEDTLASFGVGAKVVHIERGPSITRYELKPERGVKISRIANLADDIALALAATAVRIEAPIPGKSAVGIEVPNKSVSVVAIREILDTLPVRGQIPPLNFALGKDITGRPVYGDLGAMPHLLVAGATGAGKSVCLNTIVASLLVSATPDQLQMLMIDPKRVEFTVYDGIPHLIKPVISDPRLAAGALFEITKEMDARYERLAKAGVRKIEEYNAKYPEERLPYVVVVIDELADLMLVAPAKVETTIMRIAQLARATGIHLVVATQRPSVDVITGLIKANIPSRISFAVSAQVDSRVILDMAGAERLLGRGDMLYLPIDAPKPIRAQGALVTSGEIQRLVDFWAKQSRPENLVDVDVTPIEDEARRDLDQLCYEAAKFIIETNYASTAALQSQFSIGHPRAVRIMKQLEEVKVVGPHEGTKPRRILLTLNELEQISSRFPQSGEPDLFAS